MLNTSLDFHIDGRYTFVDNFLSSFSSTLEINFFRSDALFKKAKRKFLFNLYGVRSDHVGNQ